MKINKVKFFLSAILFVFILSGCGKPKETAVPENKPVPPSKTLTVWSFDIRTKALNLCATFFQQLHPGVKVEIIDMARHDMYIKLNAGLVLGSGLPDIVTIESDRMPSYIENFPTGFWEMTASASDYLKDFDPVKLSLSSKNGKLYSLPWDITPAVIFYRKDYFDKAGVNIEDIETWDDLIEAGKKIRKIYPDTRLLNLTIPVDGDRLFRLLMSQLGTSYFNEKGEVTINSQNAVRAMGLIQKLKNENFMILTKSLDEAIANIKTGRNVIIVNGLWWGELLKSSAPEQSGKWMISLLPSFDKGGTRGAILSGVALAITSQSKNPELAWEFIKASLATIENQDLMYKKFNLFPSFIPAYNTSTSIHDDNYFYKISELRPRLADITKAQKNPNYTPDYIKAQEYSIESLDEVINKNVNPKVSLDKTSENIAYVTGRQIAK